MVNLALLPVAAAAGLAAVPAHTIPAGQSVPVAAAIARPVVDSAVAGSTRSQAHPIGERLSVAVTASAAVVAATAAARSSGSGPAAALAGTLVPPRSERAPPPQRG